MRGESHISKEDNKHSSEICDGNSAFLKDWLKETQKAVLGNINEKKSKLKKLDTLYNKKNLRM